MERELKKEAPSPRPARRLSQEDSQLLTLDIVAISAPTFYTNLKKESNEFFTTSLYEINRFIDEKREKRL